MSRFPLVLGAVVSSCHPDRQSPLFGIFPLWSFLTSDRTLAFDIGPKEAWYQSAREYRLLTDEALRILRSEFPKEELADRLLRAVPEFCGRILLTSGSPHRSWLEGQHHGTPWVWHIPDVFRVLDAEPQGAGTPADVALTKAEAKAVKAFAAAVRELDKENPPSIRTVFDYLVDHGCGGYDYDRGDFEAFKRALFRGRKKLDQALVQEPRSAVKIENFYGR